MAHNGTYPPCKETRHKRFHQAKQHAPRRSSHHSSQCPNGAPGQTWCYALRRVVLIGKMFLVKRIIKTKHPSIWLYTIFLSCVYLVFWKCIRICVCHQVNLALHSRLHPPVSCIALSSLKKIWLQQWLSDQLFANPKGWGAHWMNLSCEWFHPPTSRDSYKTKGHQGTSWCIWCLGTQSSYLVIAPQLSYQKRPKPRLNLDHQLSHACPPAHKWHRSFFKATQLALPTIPTFRHPAVLWLKNMTNNKFSKQQ